MENKINIFINKAKLKHGDKYDYSKVEINNCRSILTITCPEHGDFSQRYDSHISGAGCNKCNYDKQSSKLLFIEKANEKHNNKFDYSLANYINNNTKIKVICGIHGEFETIPKKHINRGDGCPGCKNKNPYLNKKDKLFTDFINKSKEKHGDKYDYTLVKYENAKSKVKIICPEHSEFEQTPNAHKQGKGCSLCNESTGEKVIRVYLEERNIKFISQYKFSDCKHKKELKFDFYLPEFNLCIEYNGIQHYEIVNHFGSDSFNKTNIRDKIKKEYCQKNNIPLLIIKYNENIISILDSILNSLL